MAIFEIFNAKTGEEVKNIPEGIEVKKIAGHLAVISDGAFSAICEKGKPKRSGMSQTGVALLPVGHKVLVVQGKDEYVVSTKGSKKVRRNSV